MSKRKSQKRWHQVRMQIAKDWAAPSAGAIEPPSGYHGVGRRAWRLGKEYRERLGIEGREVTSADVAALAELLAGAVRLKARPCTWNKEALLVSAYQTGKKRPLFCQQLHIHHDGGFWRLVFLGMAACWSGRLLAYPRSAPRSGAAAKTASKDIRAAQMEMSWQEGQGFACGFCGLEPPRDRFPCS